MKLLYEGSVKNIYLAPESAEKLIFDYTDDYSVFDWGKMPDSIPGKGQALTELAVYFFERLKNPEAWRRFFAAHQSLLDQASVSQKAVGEKLKSQGLHTHFAQRLSDTQILVDRVHVNASTGSSILDRAGELIPLEVVFRHELTSQSSALERHPDFKPGQVFTTPFIECFTKLEPTDRFLDFTEAQRVGGLSSARFQEVLDHTHWLSLFLKHCFAEKDIKLIDGKFEWAISRTGELMLVDSIGPDELRLERDGNVLSKESLRSFYRETPWYRETVSAKAQAAQNGHLDWKKYVKSVPPLLPIAVLDQVSLMYRDLSRRITR